MVPYPSHSGNSCTVCTVGTGTNTLCGIITKKEKYSGQLSFLFPLLNYSLGGSNLCPPLHLNGGLQQSPKNWKKNPEVGSHTVRRVAYCPFSCNFGIDYRDYSMTLSLVRVYFRSRSCFTVSSIADPDPGSSAFLTPGGDPGSGSGKGKIWIQEPG